jgi:hypothetical protein
MKKVMVLLFVVAGTVAIYAGGVNEQDIVQETRTLEFATRSDWLYKINLEASTLAGTKDDIAKYAGQYGVTSIITLFKLWI